MKRSPVIILFVCAAIAMGSSGTKKQMFEHIPVRFAIHHADPWAVKAMIEGNAPSFPELSTIWNLSGGSNQPKGGQNAASSVLLEDGYLVVNPTDNSLWWYPKSTR